MHHSLIFKYQLALGLLDLIFKANSTVPIAATLFKTMSHAKLFGMDRRSAMFSTWLEQKFPWNFIYKNIDIFFAAGYRERIAWDITIVNSTTSLISP